MRPRIVGLAVCASALAIALFGVPLAVAVLQCAMQDERSQLRSVADAVAIVVADDIDNANPIGDDIGRYGSIDVAVYNDDGVLLGGRPAPSPSSSRLSQAAWEAGPKTATSSLRFPSRTTVT